MESLAMLHQMWPRLEAQRAHRARVRAYLIVNHPRVSEQSIPECKCRTALAALEGLQFLMHTTNLLLPTHNKTTHALTKSEVNYMASHCVINWLGNECKRIRGVRTCLLRFGGVEKLDWQCSHTKAVGAGCERFWCARRASLEENLRLQCTTLHSISEADGGESEPEPDDFLRLPLPDGLERDDDVSEFKRSSTRTRLYWEGISATGFFPDDTSYRSLSEFLRALEPPDPPADDDDGLGFPPGFCDMAALISTTWTHRISTLLREDRWMSSAGSKGLVCSAWALPHGLLS